MSSSIEAIKNSVPLREFLEEHGIIFHPVGQGWRSDVCPHCGQGQKGSNKLALLQGGTKWRCFSCGRGGDIIDAASALWCISTKDAIHKLAHEQWVSSAPPVERKINSRTVNGKGQEEEKRERTQALHEVIKEIHRISAKVIPDAEVISYITKIRQIPGKLVSEAQMRGMIGFLPANPIEARDLLQAEIGKDRMVKAGLWHPEKRMPAIAYRPLVFFMADKKSAEFRLGREAREGERKAIRYGSSSLPWYWMGDYGDRVAIVEGMIDLLSIVALGFKGDVVGLPGASVWRPEWFSGAQRVYTCLDPDKAGKTATQRIKNACERMGIQVQDRSPEKGDINDLLRERKESPSMALSA